MEISARSLFFGELFADFSVGLDRQLEWSPGGAPANACVSAVRSGGRGVLIAAVGADQIGTEILNALRRNGVETESVGVVDDATSLALQASGLDTSDAWTFYRHADIRITHQQVRELKVTARDVACIGALSFSDIHPVAAAHSFLTRVAELDVPIVLDCNYRAATWTSEHAYVRAMKQLIGRCQVVKANCTEAKLVTGLTEPGPAAQALVSYGADLAIVTLAASGCAYATSRFAGTSPVIGPSGANMLGTGDSFVGALVASICMTGFESVLRDHERLNIAVAGSVEEGRRITHCSGAGW